MISLGLIRDVALDGKFWKVTKLYFYYFQIWYIRIIKIKDVLRKGGGKKK